MKNNLDKSIVFTAKILLLVFVSLAIIKTNSPLYAQENDKLVITVNEGQHWQHSFRVMLVIKFKNESEQLVSLMEDGFSRGEVSKLTMDKDKKTN